MSITRTYRNAQEVIDIAGGFIQRNTSQIRKALVSSKHIVNPVIIQSYSENVDRKKYEGKGGIMPWMRYMVSRPRFRMILS